LSRRHAESAALRNSARSMVAEAGMARHAMDWRHLVRSTPFSLLIYILFVNILFEDKLNHLE
jgi:hypothetical protein